MSVGSREKKTLRLSDFWILGLGALAWAGSEYLRVRRAPRLAVEREAQRALNRMDREARGYLRWEGREETARRLSDVGAYALAPVVCALAVRTTREAATVARAVFLVGLFNQGIKFLAPRVRPFAIGRPEVQGADRYGSFFSSHASATATMAGATAALALQDAASPARAMPSLALSAAVGYLRIAADRHHLTDVLAGFVFGGAAGFTLGRSR